MKRTVLVLAIAAATIGISSAPLAGADPSNCQTVSGATICGQGSLRGGGQSGGAPAAPAPAGGGCVNAYGGYQNCNIH